MVHEKIVRHATAQRERLLHLIGVDAIHRIVRRQCVQPYLGGIEDDELSIRGEGDRIRLAVVAGLVIRRVIAIASSL